MLKPQFKPVSRKSDLVTQEVGNEILIYDLIINKAFSLNDTSATIWQLCNGENTVSDIAVDLTKAFNSQISEDFVWLALGELEKYNLLKNSDEISEDFNGLSRREIIRKIGLTSLVALPLISSLIAPTAIHATSGCTPPLNRTTNTVCTQSCQCGPTTAGNTQCCRTNASGSLRCLTTSGASSTSQCLTT